MNKPISIPVVAASAAAPQDSCSNATPGCDCNTCPGAPAKKEAASDTGEAEPTSADFSASLLNPALLTNPEQLFSLLKGTFSTPMTRGILDFLREQHQPVWSRLLAWHFGYAVSSRLAAGGLGNEYRVSAPSGDDGAPRPSGPFRTEDEAYAALLEEALLGDFFDGTWPMVSKTEILSLASEAGFDSVDGAEATPAGQSQRLQAFWTSMCQTQAADASAVMRRTARPKATSETTIDSWLQPEIPPELEFSNPPPVIPFKSFIHQAGDAVRRIAFGLGQAVMPDSVPRTS